MLNQEQPKLSSVYPAHQEGERQKGMLFCNRLGEGSRAMKSLSIIVFEMSEGGNAW